MTPSFELLGDADGTRHDLPGWGLWFAQLPHCRETTFRIRSTN